MKTKNLILIMLSFTVFLFADVPARGQNKSGTGTIKGDTVIYTCPMHPEIQSNPGTCPKCGMELVKKSEATGKQPNMKIMSPQDSVLYTCSMHPEIQSTQAGNCPKCGMKLIEKSTAPVKKEKEHKMSSMGMGAGIMAIGMLFFMIAR